MNQILQGNPVTVFGNGEQTRAFTYINDVAPIIADCVSNPETYNQVFNIGSNEVHSINSIIRIIANEFNVNPQIIYHNARPEVLNAFSDHSKAIKYFGTMLKETPIQEGIKKMAVWAKNIGPQSSKKFSNIETREKLPLIWQ